MRIHAVGYKVVLSTLILLEAACNGNGTSGPDPQGTVCSPNAAGWQHQCIGDLEFRETSSEVFWAFYEEEDIDYYFAHACCEGAAVKATADAACQAGCYVAGCNTLFAVLSGGGIHAHRPECTRHV